MEEKKENLSSVSCFGRDSPRYLTSLSNLFIVVCTLYTHKYTLHIVAVVDCTRVRHVVQNISEYCAPIHSQLQLLLRTW